MTPPGVRGHPGPLGGSGDDPECIFVITEAYVTNSTSNIFYSKKFWKRIQFIVFLIVAIHLILGKFHITNIRSDSKKVDIFNLHLMNTPFRV